MNTDSAVPGLNRNNALSSEVVVPPASEIYKFNDMVAPIFQKMILNINQIRTLETLRDTLLPKLISGEVRVCYESFPVRETIKEPYLPWLENTWLAILEVVYRISKQPYANHIGQTIFQKVCYIMTEETGLPLRLQYEQGDFGPFSKQITPVLQKLSKEKFVKKHSLGKMDEILLTQNYEQHRDNFLPIIAQFEDNIQKTVDLFCRIKNTEQAEEVATVLYAARQLLDVNTKNKVSEQQVLDYVLEWKPQWQEEIKREAIGIAIRNLGGLGWLDLEYCDSLPDESL